MILDYLQLQSISDYSVLKCPTHLPEIKACLEVMNVTGCRAQESFTVSMWEISNPPLFVLKPQKNNNARVFYRNNLPEFWCTLIEENDRIKTFVNYRKLQYSLVQIIGKFNLQVGDKSCMAHMYRHTYAKALQYFGNSDEEIKESFGHKHLASTMKYINSIPTATSLP